MNWLENQLTKPLELNTSKLLKFMALSRFAQKTIRFTRKNADRRHMVYGWGVETNSNFNFNTEFDLLAALDNMVCNCGKCLKTIICSEWCQIRKTATNTVICNCIRCVDAP